MDKIIISVSMMLCQYLRLLLYSYPSCAGGITIYPPKVSVIYQTVETLISSALNHF